MFLRSNFLYFVVTLSCFTTSIAFESGSGYDYDYNDESNITYTDSVSANPCFDKEFDELWQANEDSLEALFGSLEKAVEVLPNCLAEDASYWFYDQAFFEIKSKLNNTDHLDPVDREKVVAILDAINDKMTELCQYSYLCKKSKTIREVLDCAIGRRLRNEFFHTIDTILYFAPSTWQCEALIPSLWWKVVNVTYMEKTCTLNQALSALLELDLYGKIVYSEATSLDPPPSVIDTTKLDFVLALSKPDALELLLPILCNNDRPETCKIYENAICEPLHYLAVARVTKLIDESTSDAENIFTLLDVQRSLGHVSNKLSTVLRGRVGVNEVESAKKMLTNYFGIIDTVIGNDSIQVWNERVSPNTAKQEFEKILVDSEEFVGGASYLILGGKSYEDFNISKETLDVQMKRTRSSSLYCCVQQ